MGLDTYADDTGSENEFVGKCKDWLKKNKMIPADVDIDETKTSTHSPSWPWTACNSRVLANTISKIQGLDFPFSSALNEDFRFHRDMDAEETLQMGKRCLEFIERHLKELPENHTIANGYTMENNQFVPAGQMPTKDVLRYCEKLARWFVMVGECGFGTVASY